jgi:alkylated DNA repair dioxygenase AlkB
MQNLLPADGLVYYYGKLFNRLVAQDYFDQLLTGIAWRHDEAMMFGKKIVTARKVAWYGAAPFAYTYSGITKIALPWTPVLAELLQIAQQCTGAAYNACLLNLYHHGGEGMAWHSDGEPDLLKNGSIASYSFGAERKFAFKHKQSKAKVELILEDGSLLEMAGACQTHWLHRLPPTTKISTPRINLTFRTIVAG